jgi:hypothetical protein
MQDLERDNEVFSRRRDLGRLAVFMEPAKQCVQSSA